MEDHTNVSAAHADLVAILRRLNEARDAGENWETCVAIARELGADALNIAKFRADTPVPIWIRVSTHEKGGLEEYVTRDYMSVDPVLVPRADGSMKDVDHISIHRNMAEKTLSEKELECYDHLLKYGQSDYITFRIRDKGDESEEILVVFACSSGVAEMLKADIDQLGVIANLLALYTAPPTPERPEGKVPLLYDFLTSRERDVLTALAKGMHNSEIAHELGITEVTVRMHTTGARKKMGATTRAQAIALALKRGLITV